jgi:hypothetical protein
LFGLLSKRAALAGATVILAVLSMGPALLENRNKPLIPWATNIFHYDRTGQMSAIRFEMSGVLGTLNEHVRKDAPIVFAGSEDSWDYPLFGAHRERRVVRVANPTDVTYAELSREHVAGAYFANVGTPPLGLRAIPLGPDYWWVPALRRRPSSP